MCEPTASVVLCVWNGAATLEQQLAALAAQDFEQPWELVVVDNGSTDATRDIATGWIERLPIIRLIDEPRAGVNRARNRGVGAARAATVVCCDADDEVSPSWLRAMTVALDEYDLVGGALDPDRISPPDAPRDTCHQRTGLPSLFGVPYALGANLGFRRTVFDAIGGFDERFNVGSDDTDFGLRAQYAGFSIGFAPDAVVYYRVKSTARAVMRQRFGYGRGHNRLVDKHARLDHIRSRLVLRWKIVAVGAVRLVSGSPAILHRRTRLQYLARVAYLAGQFAELTHQTLGTVSRRRGSRDAV